LNKFDLNNFSFNNRFMNNSNFSPIVTLKIENLQSENKELKERIKSMKNDYEIEKNFLVSLIDKN